MTKAETLTSLKQSEISRSQAQLNLLEQICEQQAEISKQLKELLEVLTAPSDSKLIDEIAELLQQLLKPLSDKLNTIDQQLSTARKPT